MSPARRQPPSTKARLLRDGYRVYDPDPEEQAELERMERLGLIEVQRGRFFYCVDHRDDRDLPHAHDRLCRERIPLRELGHPDDPAQPEDDGRYVCRCGRTHYPHRRRRSLYPLVTVRFSMDRAAVFLDGMVREIDPERRRLDELPVYRLVCAGREVHCCLLDACGDSRFARRGFAETNPTVYLAIDRVRAERFAVGTGGAITWVPFHGIAEQGRPALLAALEAALAPQQPEQVRESAVPWLSPVPPRPRVHRELLGVHKLVVTGQSASLDGVEVLGADAAGLHAVVWFLAGRWVEDLRDGKQPDDFCLFTQDEVYDELRRQKHTTSKDAWMVRKHIGRVRDMIAERYEAATGIRLRDDEILQNVPRRGYRLNPETLFVVVP